MFAESAREQTGTGCPRVAPGGVLPGPDIDSQDYRSGSAGLRSQSVVRRD